MKSIERFKSREISKKSFLHDRLCQNYQKSVKMKYCLEDNSYDRFFTGKERHSNQNLSTSECLYQKLQSNAQGWRKWAVENGLAKVTMAPRFYRSRKETTADNLLLFGPSDFRTFRWLWFTKCRQKQEFKWLDCQKITSEIWENLPLSIYT